MIDSETRLTVLREFLTCGEKIYLWKYDNDFQLLDFDCEESVFYDEIFRSSGCCEKIKTHFSQKARPIIISDSIGLVWLAACDKEKDIVRYFYVIGPIFTNDMSDQILSEYLRNYTLSIPLKKGLTSKLQMIPVVIFTTLQRYGLMLHYSVTGQMISDSDITQDHSLQTENADNFEQWRTGQIHGTWEIEQHLLQIVKDGNINLLNSKKIFATSGQPGILCPGNPIRQKKDEMIVLTALCTRAAISGGLLPEVAYTLSDFYIQRLENAKTVDEIMNCSFEVIRDFTTRVHEQKQNSNYGKSTQACINYIDFHIFSKIQLAKMASELGYASYYLTACFKRDTGISLNEYINRRKIEKAKDLLLSSNIEIKALSEKLCFSNSSYFCSIFHKFTGMTPNEYRNMK